ncbi:hypothetical protein [Thermogemmatispora sp.]|uniref:hypothetical protein n=1 Tax=Thermogemmatispora sp. TaxID=1968838 RepID=UPI0035E465F9
MVRLFLWLYRFVSKREKPLLQLLVGILLIPAGALVAYAACSGEYIYPYWVISGGGLAFFGIALVLKGLIILLGRRRSSPAAAAPSGVSLPVAGAGLEASPSLAGQAFFAPPYSSAQPAGGQQMPAGPLFTGGSLSSAGPTAGVPYGGAAALPNGQQSVAPPPQLSWWGGMPWSAGQMGYPGYQYPGPQPQAGREAQPQRPPEVSSR